MGNQAQPIDIWKTRVRKDPLGFAGFNQLLGIHRATEGGFYQVSHILDTDYAHHAGEHNEAVIPRDVGDVKYVVGVATMEAAKYAAVASHPATGDVRLSFSGYTFPTLWDYPYISLQATSMSENGPNKPCIVGASIVGDNDIRFFSHFLSSALGTNTTWTAEDAPFAFAIHGQPRPAGTPLVLPGYVARGSTLVKDNWTSMVQASADLWANFGQGHSQSTGVHTARVVPKGWGLIQYHSGGPNYVAAIDSTPDNHITSVTRVGQGHVKVTFNTAWTLPMQPFFAIDYNRFGAGTPSKPYVIVAPYSLQTTTVCELYIYSYDTVANSWGRDDTDFWLTVHAG
jgi:hypothetical protein